MFTLTALYSLRAVIVLARHSSDYVGRQPISKSAHIPHDYLQKVMSDLETAGIVVTRRGPGGGYKLTRSPKQISVWDIISAADGIHRIDQCPLGFAAHISLCPLHQHLDLAIGKVQEDLEKVKIIEFCQNT